MRFPWSPRLNRQKVLILAGLSGCLGLLLCVPMNMGALQLSRAEVDNQHGRTAQAVAHAQHAIRLLQLWPVLHFQQTEQQRLLAESFRISGEPVRALDTAREAVRLDPDDTLAKITLANLYFESGGDEQAIKLWMGVPHAATWLFERAAHAAAQHQYEEALRLYQATIDIDGNARASLAAGIIYQDQRHASQQSIPYLEAAVTKDARVSPWVYVRLGSAYGDMQRVPEAVAWYQQGTRIFPADAWLRYYLGRALISEGELSAGRRELQEAMNLQASDPELTAAISAALRDAQLRTR